jgi:hypothetical protein
MTRSFVAMAHLDLRSAWRCHRIGPLVFGVVLLQVPYRSLRLLSRRFSRRTAGWDGAVGPAFGLGLAALLLIAWAFRIVHLV